MQMNQNILFALKTEKIVMFIILTLIVLVAAFGIASTLFMVVMEKTRDIAILKSMGATGSSIMRIFVLEGLVIGVIGTGMGLVLGLTLCGLLKRYRIHPVAQRRLSHLHLAGADSDPGRAGHRPGRHGHQLSGHPSTPPGRRPGWIRWKRFAMSRGDPLGRPILLKNRNSKTRRH